MIRPGIHSRGISSNSTPDSGEARVTADARASRLIARALGLLVERLSALGAVATDAANNTNDRSPAPTASTAPSATQTADDRLVGVRDALRQLAARSREGVMLCRVVHGKLVLEGVPVDRGVAGDDAHLATLLSRLMVLNVGSLTIRESAAPGELLTLGRMLADADMSAATMRASADTPTTSRAVAYADATHPELLRTWSVLMTPTIAPRTAETTSVVAGSVLAHFTSARTDTDATRAVESLVELLDDIQRRGDGTALEGVVRVVLEQLQQIGDGAGRLAMEHALRQMERAPLLTLLAKQLPQSTDRSMLLQLFSRAGDAGVQTLVEQLMATDDSLARRAYFDSIVAMDVGSAHLFVALDDRRWYVVRNAAAILGEMGVAHADEALIALLAHSDERIRVAIARALMRLRTVKAFQALQGAIDDTNSEVRRLSAAAFALSGSGSGSVRPPAARLAAALEREVDEDAALEMLAALGKLGSADAIQRLLRTVLPVTTDLSGVGVGEPRPAWLRIAALEALLRARGHNMLPVLNALINDDDSEVAQVARDCKAAY